MWSIFVWWQPRNYLHEEMGIYGHLLPLDVHRMVVVGDPTTPRDARCGARSPDPSCTRHAFPVLCFPVQCHSDDDVNFSQKLMFPGLIKLSIQVY
jgi:hypothetical protein